MTISYFGYGSLVNPKTLSGETAIVPGRLSGWVREWRICGKNANGQGVCALNAAREKGAEIRGVLAQEPAAGLAALQKREWKYDRIDEIGQAFSSDEGAAKGPGDMFLFAAKRQHHRWGDQDHPILQSYLDCVLAGFHAHWGQDGIAHFIATTRGWHVPILADRERPRYPRAVTLSSDFQAMIDSHLSAVSVEYITPEGS